MITELKKIISRERIQYTFFLILSFLIIGFSIILCLTNPLSFRRYFGDINPLLMIFIIIILAFVLFSVGISYSWFNIYKRNLRGIAIISIPASLLVMTPILIDINFVYPENINVLFPYSLLFYPTMGFVVEILFHLVPLSLLLIVLTSVFKNVKQKKIIWISIFIVSLLEPVFQMIFGTPSDFPLWIVIFFGFHLYLFNFLQLFIFKRYDFFTMYLFRLVYYLFWHILWGYLRLGLLF
ncbi:MAG: hypothetical protein ACFFA8_07565 [Promethearchaeota archaeon]